MTNAQIDEYLCQVRKWPRRPTDYDATTESIIRRYLRGEIEIGTYSGNDSAPNRPGAVGQIASEGGARSTLANDERLDPFEGL